MQPWNDWYHVCGNTYGTWLKGDPRGFRTRKHREHVDGDYRNPPPEEKYTKLHEQSQSQMKRSAVWLAPPAQLLACQIMAESLSRDDCEPIAIAVDSHHFHALVRCTDQNPRKWVGLAKRRSATALSKGGFVEPGGAWATRSLCKPIRDRGHQVRVFRYIVAHGKRNASVWRYDQTPDENPG